MSRSQLGRIVITGGAGLVGSTICDRLIDSGCDEIVVFDDFSRGRKENLARAMEDAALRIVEGDIRDPAQVRAVLEGADVVFHQAGIRITQCAAHPRDGLEILVDGSFNVFEAAAEVGVRKVVAASSASIYGMAELFPTTEDHHPYDNQTLYGAAKLFNEGTLRALHQTHGLDYVALRYFNVYGPRMDIHGKYTEVLIRWMQRMDRGEAPVIFGDGSDTMDLIAVEDIARANILAAQSDSTDRAYNIASGVEHSLLDLCEALLRAMGSDLTPEFAPARSVNAVSRRVADVRAAERDLGFRSEIDLDEGVRRLVEWWRDRGAASVEDGAAA